MTSEATTEAGAAIIELMEHQRAIRLFKPDDVDDATIERILNAATRAPSAKNVQPWRFIVVRDVETKRKLGAIFDELGVSLLGYAEDQSAVRTAWAETPVLLVVCSEGASAEGSSVFPAVQNLLLAVQAVGLGGLLTTRWKAREDEVRAVLGIPAKIGLHAIVPVGHPQKPPGRNRRRPARELTALDRFGNPW